MPDEGEGVGNRLTEYIDNSQSARQDRLDLLSAKESGSAFKGLVARHGGRLYRYIRSRISHRQTCEDLTQDVFLRLCSAAYNGKTSVKTWLFIIARNRVIDFLRAESRRGCESHAPEQFEFPQPHPSDPARNLTREDEDRRIAAWLGKLPDEQAEAVRLRIIAGLSFAQTAEVLGCSVPTCKSRVRYALAKLKTIIEQDMNHELRA